MLSKGSRSRKSRDREKRIRRPRSGARLREASALLTQARYLNQDRGVVHTDGEGDHVVLLHGLYASAGVFRPLRALLEATLKPGFHSFSYMPGPGIEELSHRLGKLVSEIDTDKPIHLVGHSLGGLVQRHYVAGDSCDSRVVQSLSLAAPFRGSKKSWLVPGQAGRDIAPNSAVLSRLRAANTENCRVPHLTLAAEEDEIILPDAFPQYGDSRVISRVGHNGILFDDDSMARISDRLLNLRLGQM